MANQPSPVAEGADARLSSPSKSQLIPIVDERQEDEEENILREMKDRESRKQRDEQTRASRKAAQEAEEAAKLAQVKAHEKDKQFTYDSDGNILLVQPLPVTKLPNTTPAPSFACKEDELGSQQPVAPDGKTPAASGRSRNAKGLSTKKRQSADEFQDGFKKFASQQPLMIDAMEMAPGVELEERKKTKKGEDKDKAFSHTNMSRKDYEEMLKKTGGFARGVPQDASPSPPEPAASSKMSEQSPGATGISAIPEEASAAPDPATTQDSTQVGPRAGETMRVVRAEMGAELVPKPPATPRPVQPKPPQIARRMQSKRDALGYALSSRERVQSGYGGSRYPGGTAQPPLGATMGHGLVPGDRKYEDYFFPNMGDRVPLGSMLEELDEGQAPSRLAPIKMQGQIVSKNPQLKSRLFGKA